MLHDWLRKLGRSGSPIPQVGLLRLTETPIILQLDALMSSQIHNITSDATLRVS